MIEQNGEAPPRCWFGVVVWTLQIPSPAGSANFGPNKWVARCFRDSGRPKWLLWSFWISFKATNKGYFSKTHPHYSCKWGVCLSMCILQSKISTWDGPLQGEGTHWCAWLLALFGCSSPGMIKSLRAGTPFRPTCHRTEDEDIFSFFWPL